MGPTLESATRPKLSLAASLSPRTAAMPTPIAMMNGTVIGPVVTPPESYATARKLSGTKTETTASRPYSASSSLERLMRFKMRTTASARNAPTPTAIE